VPSLLFVRFVVAIIVARESRIVAVHNPNLKRLLQLLSVPVSSLACSSRQPICLVKVNYYSALSSPSTLVWVSCIEWMATSLDERSAARCLIHGVEQCFDRRMLVKEACACV